MGGWVQCSRTTPHTRASWPQAARCGTRCACCSGSRIRCCATSWPPPCAASRASSSSSRPTAEPRRSTIVGRGGVDLVAFDADGGSTLQLRRAVEAFRAASPDVRVVALTSSSTADSIRDLLAAGLDSAISKSILSSDFGYVLRQSGRNTFFDSVLRSERPVIREAPATVPDEEPAPKAAPIGPPSSLTAREREILALVSEGTGNKQIAKQLWVTEQTVKFHLSNIYRKLQVSNRTEASRVAHCDRTDLALAPMRSRPSGRARTATSGPRTADLQ